MTDFLRKNRAEVLHTVLFAYDQEEHIRMEKEESLEEDLVRATQDREFQKKLLKEYGI